MKVLVVLLALLAALAGAATARADETVVLPAADDISLPFLCSWGYDWEERCYRDRLERLELGSAGDKVWRSALRCSLDAIPRSAEILGAKLWLRYDGTCVAPRRRTVLSGASANDGVRLKLVGEQEAYDARGPTMPSSRFADPSVRPRLVVAYVS